MQSETITLPASVDVSATGCLGASSYREFADRNGYKYVEVLNWSSSAGDWDFIVSEDGRTWQILSQTNNYPRPGFSHQISDECWEGTAEEVLNLLAEGF